MNADTALRRKVPHTGSAVKIDRLAVDRLLAEKIWRKLVGRINQPARGLEPGLNALRFGQKIPAQNHRRQADAAERAPAEL